MFISNPVLAPVNVLCAVSSNAKIAFLEGVGITAAVDTGAVLVKVVVNISLTSS